jgi:hypothetical protein
MSLRGHIHLKEFIKSTNWIKSYLEQHTEGQTEW